ncbi:catechol 2,3-dioxygenase-like lactoylglutathione lyase family enzyme [Crossiella equi]|uniref:Catechol 2,3-dioxygenase-like lactoylglutathione lyase family enzyme n=1 Tax=Crossiella equi TaxID=130796 RepID=A0ABS5AJF6_9PSEU|nr:VOC family protein [Crossiella equi]MBP2476699.1 catechol 2,3-dioxygenase-like lactoylglutathione lyase family enzyme [Crossiella equi]
MAIELNHTIVHSTDKKAGAAFLTDLFGLPDAVPFGPFMAVHLSNSVTLDYLDVEGTPTVNHYAFLVTDEEFDDIFGRIQDRGLDYWADPARSRPGEINTNDGGRGVYFLGPDDHVLEIITVSYGG